MTENLKTNMMIVFATILAVAALVYGFSSIPSPTQQRDLKLDHRRVTDLGELQFSIDEHYRNHTKLPETLEELQKNSYYSSRVLSKMDPETNKPYEYAVISETTYQLCATFTTDSSKEMDSYDSENYNYSSFKDKFTHPVGRHCFDFTAPVLAPTIEPATFTPAVNVMPINVGSNGAFQVVPPRR